jgi:nicotinamide-nucleotide amidase
MNAEIVAIGSELLLGQIVDTNSAWMAQQLALLGINLFYKTIVGDNRDRMLETLTRAIERSDVVLTCGGIGPTQDDLTREVVAEVTGRPLVRNPHLLEQIETRFRRRGFIMTPNNEKQADIPQGAIPVENPNGTAPSFIVEDPRGVIICLPGVPFEMKWLFEHEVIPYLRRTFNLTELIASRVLKVADLGESNVDDRIGHLIQRAGNPTVGVLASPGQVDVRITAKAASLEAAQHLIQPVEEEVRKLLGKHVFATDEQTMEDAVGALLRMCNLTVAVCEDVTGGMIAERLQQASPEHFVEGVIAHSDQAVKRLLEHRRPQDDMATLLADPVALTDALAWSIRAQSQTDVGLALHGVLAGGAPTENLGQGQTYIAVATTHGIRHRAYNFAGRGRPDRTRSSLNALELLRRTLLEER